MSPDRERTQQETKKPTLKQQLHDCEALFKQTGRYYGMKELQLKEDDMLRYEIFHSRLLSSVVAARETAKSVAASVHTRECGELLFGLFTPEGDAVAFSTGIMAHIGVMNAFTKWMIEHDYEQDPGINEGDHFACNDTSIVAMHTCDLDTVTPIFHEDELIGWVGAVTHILDIGAPDSGGGMTPLIVERGMEGLHICAEKVAVNDKLRREYELRIEMNVRQPSAWLLDDRAKMAGCVSVRERVKEIIREFGLDYYKQACRELIEEGRRHHLARVKEKLIPGRYRSATFMTLLMAGKAGIQVRAQKDNLLHFPFDMTIEPSGHMIIDLEGTSPEGIHNTHCRGTAVYGAMSITLIQTLHFDGKANDGSIKDIDLRLPLGTVVNASRQFTACNWGWACGVNVNQQLITCLSRAFYSRGYVEEVILGSNVTSATDLIGINQYGHNFGGVNGELVAAPSGARGIMDGINAGWSIWNPEGDQGNAEMWELVYPYIYLGRRAVVDSAGGGRFRGGQVFESLFMVWNTDTCSATQHQSYDATFANFSVYGGYPGCPTFFYLAENTNIPQLIAAREPLPHSTEEFIESSRKGQLKGDIKLKCDRSYVTGNIKNYDLLTDVHGNGSSGFGDPLDRDPQLVARDLEYGFTSHGIAEKLYGVKASFNDRTQEWLVDEEATRVWREELKRRRLKRGVPVKEWWQKQRNRLQAGEIPPIVLNEYDACKRISPSWGDEFDRFWALKK